MYDIGPIYPRPGSTPLFYNVQNLVFADWLTYDGYNFTEQITESYSEYYGIELVGQHYFQNSTTGNGLTPVWDLTQTYGPNAIALAEVVGDLPSPDSDPGSVDWQHLTVTSGSLAQEILLLYTDGGEPPSQVKIRRSVMCSMRLNVARFSVRLDQETSRSNSPHSIVSAQLLTPTLTNDLSTLCRVIWWYYWNLQC